MVRSEGELLGVFPAAITSAEPAVVVSHPGATFGGVVHNGRLAGNRMVQAMRALVEHYARNQGTLLRYKVLPFQYAIIPSQDDLYALHVLKARRYRCELSSSIAIDARREPSQRRQRSLKKAKRSVEVVQGLEYLDALHHVITANLEREHGADPVHSLEELRILTSRFPKEIVVFVATINGDVEAGVIFFNSPNVWHAQYIAASERAYAACALDAVFDAAINASAAAGVSYLDFGTSNEHGGQVLNDGLYRYKSEFGGGGVAHEYYEISFDSGVT